MKPTPEERKEVKPAKRKRQKAPITVESLIESRRKDAEWASAYNAYLKWLASGVWRRESVNADFEPVFMAGYRAGKDGR